jgi:phage baseplate assembly protein W
MANLQKIYSDIDFTFTKKPVVGDVALSYDAQAVIRSVRNILLTRRYERPFKPDFGSKIGVLLFEPVSPMTAASLEEEIEATIKNYEPRLKLQTIKVDPKEEQNLYAVTISFFIENSTLLNTVTIQLQRNR